MATGWVGPEQLARLSHILFELKREGLYRVVLIHHPPVSRPGEYFRRLVDGRQLRAALAEHGAELVLHGHNHVHSLVWLPSQQGRIPALGVPSASSPPGGRHHPAGYNLYEVTGSPGAWHCAVVSRALHADGSGFIELARETVS
jgi:3',5'-cyclic AMP phosphodiesterase CpdA